MGHASSGEYLLLVAEVGGMGSGEAKSKRKRTGGCVEGERHGAYQVMPWSCHCLVVVTGVLAWFGCTCSSSYSCCRTLAQGNDDCGDRGQRVELRRSRALVRSCRPQTAQNTGEGHEGQAGMLYQCTTACFSSLLRVLGVGGDGALVITR